MLRMEDLDESQESSESVEDRPMPPPKPSACARVRGKPGQIQEKSNISNYKA